MKKKIHHLVFQSRTSTKEINSTLFLCLFSVFNESEVVQTECENKKNFYETTRLTLIYHETFMPPFIVPNLKQKSKIKGTHRKTLECYYCGGLYIFRQKFEKHDSNCFWISGIVRTFNNEICKRLRDI